MDMCNLLHILGKGLVLFDAGRNCVGWWSATTLDRVNYAWVYIYL